MVDETKDWRRHLGQKEQLICFRLSLDIINKEGQIGLTEKEMMEQCGYKTMRAFKNQLSKLVDKNIIIFENDYKHTGNPYFFNSYYVEYNELGPRMYFRPLENVQQPYA